jgi:uncharacterized protein (DUF362 family)
MFKPRKGGDGMERDDIYVIYGNDPAAMIKELLEKTEPVKGLDKDALIGIKPNLVVAKPSSSGATTTPQLVEGVIKYLKANGYKRIEIMEGSWVGDYTSDAFRICGYEEISRRYGVPLVDLQRDDSKSVDVGDMKLRVCSSVEKVDYLINMPVLKGHCQTNITCALKNLKGCIPNSEKRRFHTMGLHKPIAYLNKAIKQDLIIVDGLCGDLDFEEGGNPVPMNRLIAGTDPVLLDSYAARLLGFSLEEVQYIKIAESLGVGSSDLSRANIRELNKDKNMAQKISSRKAQHLARYIDADCACSACYGSLIHALARLDERGELRRLKTKLCIGQGFKNKKFDGTGIGLCTSGAGKCVKGCPPAAKDIINFLENDVLI